MDLTKKRVLVLITEKTGPNDKNWDFFAQSLSVAFPDHSVEVTMGELVNLTFMTDENGDKVYDRVRGFSLDDFDLVVFRFIRREYARASACASFLQARNIPYVDSQIKPGYWSKYAALVLRYHEGFPPIPSVFATHSELQYMFEHDLMPFEYPLVIKDVNGKKGMLNFIAHSKQEAISILRDNPGNFIVQKFIKNDGDYRFLVIGGEVKLAIYRQATGGSHLNNTSQGATASVVDTTTFDKQVIQDAIHAAALEHLEIAGVDVMFDKETGQHYIIEVNSSPQLATGATPDLKMKAYASYLYKRMANPVRPE